MFSPIFHLKHFLFKLYNLKWNILFSHFALSLTFTLISAFIFIPAFICNTICFQYDIIDCQIFNFPFYIPSLYYSFWDLLLSFWCFTWNMRIYFHFGVWNLPFSILSIHLSRFSCIFIIFQKNHIVNFSFLCFTWNIMS